MTNYFHFLESKEGDKELIFRN